MSSPGGFPVPQPLCGIILALLPLFAWLGCGSHPPDADILSVREVGPVRFIESIRGRDGGESSLFDGMSVWVYGDTTTEVAGVDGESWRSSTFCYTDDFEAGDGIDCRGEPVDSNGVPGEFLPFTEEELEFNLTYNRPELPDDERARWALWPSAIVTDPETGRALIFYQKLFARLGDWNFDSVGHSIATWDGITSPVVRPEVRPDAEHPTLLFPVEEITIGQGVLVHEGFLYAYGCGVNWVTDCPCVLGRAPLSGALDRDSWEFYRGRNTWSDNPRNAVKIAEGAPQISVHWNEHLGRFLMVYNDPLGNKLYIRTAEAPEGPWSDAKKILDEVPPLDDSQWNYCAYAHPELSKENGRIEYLSYFRPTEFLKGEVRVVEVIFK